MIYITYVQPPRYHQLTFEEMMAGITVNELSELKVGTSSGTRTVCVTNVPQKLREIAANYQLNLKLALFNDKYKAMIENPNRQSLYYRFYIPKKSGGLREINAPLPELKSALNELKTILSDAMLADHHTAAFAYVRGRSTLDAVKQHQKWASQWFVKFDLHDFFGSTTLEFLMDTFLKIYPFCLLREEPNGIRNLRTALSLCTLHGGLPQGTPISPFLTNVMMIPFDHRMFNQLHNFNMSDTRTERFVYTRYADDMCISCRVDFPYKVIENYIIDTLRWMHAPFQLNTQKTHYGSRSGQNWILGVMLNKDNEISIGHREKKYFESMLTSYILSHGQGTFSGSYSRDAARPWPLEDVRKLHGLYSYYKMVEPVRIQEIVEEYNRRFGVNFEALLKTDEQMISA